jgi:hypothetical protein
MALTLEDAKTAPSKGHSSMILVGLLRAVALTQPVYNNVPVDYLRV